MEIVVSSCIGLLCGLCLFGFLTGTGTSGSEWIWPFAREQSPRGVLLACAAAIGRGLHASTWKFKRILAVVDEVRRLRMPAVGSLEDASADEAAGVFVLFSMASAVLLFVLTGSMLGAFGGCAAPALLLSVGARAEAHRQKARVEEAMPEAFGALAIALGSGLSLAQAMRYVGSHAEEPVRTAFMKVAFSITCGIPAAEALDAMIARLRAPGLELVTLALKISQRTGAPLKGLLADAATLVEERIDLVRRLDVKTSQARMSARLVACMPLAMMAFLTLLSSDFREGLATVPGALSIAVALVMNAAAWLIIRKIMQIRL